ncbi:hypothetical protein GXW83_17650 [Streptacidiphilus sp. PB12-B1b]|uniref:hypothetical protein n=1 Tax=Streptacidiphilus sp. PB12-B1b TaxID=2705012 RepID=UPI0015FBBB17|nr:hypothetical protein [Streptacidiphilus sp. PB12-B1b]QMU77250.1 hypothetical protein GXW83_17615 [Streptacidiphilus sp. PB12-B1b]QMU77254.1 hypothetical protein GXW83_17650 [Streptacidiphilus sp. PB12-B1b]
MRAVQWAALVSPRRRPMARQLRAPSRRDFVAAARRAEAGRAAWRQAQPRGGRELLLLRRIFAEEPHGQEPYGQEVGRR